MTAAVLTNGCITALPPYGPSVAELSDLPLSRSLHLLPYFCSPNASWCTSAAWGRTARNCRRSRKRATRGRASCCSAPRRCDVRFHVDPVRRRRLRPSRSCGRSTRLRSKSLLSERRPYRPRCSDSRVVSAAALRSWPLGTCYAFATLRIRFDASFQLSLMLRCRYYCCFRCRFATVCCTRSPHAEGRRR